MSMFVTPGTLLRRLRSVQHPRCDVFMSGDGQNGLWQVLLDEAVISRAVAALGDYGIKWLELLKEAAESV